ncbi:hypothetical protein TREPR_2594 [Treponema primitia ZAS-2]|uniref:Uncharacterized protein n=1 Tax=Treponema primitia (strain ATCC BAA-887 / DSM 12427 / ZAS-2) TaxID=545694 RepID=F5YGJ0_TREPZ|nr:AAA family ATPase [Treponema primitia]AEF83700.1 hypothetical protein TREPR_2594 [Treponema primitia ZAS-2]
MNILITGAAGTGKTFLIKRLQTIHKNWCFTGMTNQSASLINGKTIHSHFGFTTNWFDELTIPHNKKATIVIDEASMLSQEQLEMMNRARPFQNIVLIGDFNQLLPVKGTPIKPESIDEMYILTKQYRSKDIILDRFLNGLLNNKIDWDLIEDRKSNHTDEKTLFITYENSSREEYNKLFSLKRNSPVKARTHRIIDGLPVSYRDSRETRFKHPFWFNNELFTIYELTNLDIVLFNERLGIKTLARDIFDDYFQVNFSSTFHSVQGQTREGRTIIHLDSLTKKYQDPDKRMRALYVASSRVKNINDLYFSYDDLENIRKEELKYMYSFSGGPLSGGSMIKELKALEVSQDDILKIPEWGYVRKSLLCSIDRGSGDPLKVIKDIKPKTEKEIIERKALCLEYLKNYKDPYTTREMSSLLEVSPKTIRKYLKEIETITKAPYSYLYGVDKFANYDNGTIKNKPDETTQFVSINPIYLTDISEGKKTNWDDDHAASYSNFVFESDNISIEKQIEMAYKLGSKGIVNRSVHSGGKSIHCRITVKDEPKNKDEYHYVWDILNIKYFEGQADRACKNPSRKTRCPGAMRDNGNIQELLFENNSILDIEWRGDYEREKRGIELDRACLSYIKKGKKIVASSGVVSLNELSRKSISNKAKKLIDNSFIDGEKHIEIPGGVASLKRLGVDKETVFNLVKATKIKEPNIKAYFEKLWNYFE